MRRDGPTARLYSRNAYDWTARFQAVAAAAKLIKAKSFTIDGETVVLGPDGLSIQPTKAAYCVSTTDGLYTPTALLGAIR